MGFADAYLLKAGLRESLITNDPHSDLKLIVTIPVHNESGLARCLDSLFIALPLRVESSASPGDESSVDESSGVGSSGDGSSGDGSPGDGSPGDKIYEVLILINAGTSASAEVLAQNQATLTEVREWIAAHPHPQMDFHVWLDHSFGRKEAGVGMARKILMDEAARRFSLVGNPDGIIASMDADTLVDPNYFAALAAHFEELSCDGCSIRFEHPLAGFSEEDDFPSVVYEAIAQYELHLHYYVAAVRSTGYPYAYHTVGSAFAVRAGIYCLEGGMNKRQGGEDFYFIQKVAQRGNWSECQATCVRPSPRPSNRVPFGTGPVVGKLIEEVISGGLAGEVDSGGSTEEADSGRSVSALQTYHPEPFEMLKDFFFRIDELYSGAISGEKFGPAGDSGPAGNHDSAGDVVTPVLSAFLTSQKFSEALAEIRGNSGSAEAFRKRFWRWFNMFRIMKFLHYAREHGYPDVDVDDAVHRFLSLEKSCTVDELLGLFRASR